MRPIGRACSLKVIHDNRAEGRKALRRLARAGPPRSVRCLGARGHRRSGGYPATSYRRSVKSTASRSEQETESRNRQGNVRKPGHELLQRCALFSRRSRGPRSGHIFANLGTDHVSLIEEIARWTSKAASVRRLFCCPHEIAAVHSGRRLRTGDREGTGRFRACRRWHRKCMHGDPEHVSLPFARDVVRRPRAISRCTANCRARAIPMSISCRIHSTLRASFVPV